MADNRKKPTQAQRASGQSRAAAARRPSAKKQEPDPQHPMPLRMLVAMAALALFIVFLVMFVNHDGVLVSAFYQFILGLVGRVGFYVSIPALLYLFIIQGFSGERPVRMRSWCLLAFVLCCGCLSHPLEENVPEAGALIVKLYYGGVEGSTAGVLCGGITTLLVALLNPLLFYILGVMAAIFTIMGALQITIPSIVRAVENRPRAQWEGKNEPKPEPASLVVNAIANKRIEHQTKKREAAALSEPKPAPRRSKPAQHFQPEPAASVDKLPVPDVDMDMIQMSVSRDVQQHMEEASPAEVPAVESITEPKTQKVTAKEAEASAQEVAREIEENEQMEKKEYCFPPKELLSPPVAKTYDGAEEMRESKSRLEEALESFHVDARVLNVTRGPSVTLYEVELTKGVRLAKLTAIDKDLALTLGASGVRISPIPGKASVVGIEVPNKRVNMVTLREVVDSLSFRNAPSCTSFAVGKDISGNCVIGDVKELPHMLIAGTTGSGKSVCMNSIITSILYKASPEDVKLIMIDPKMVELGVYNDIPHLMIPVVTDPKKAAGSLQWAVTEMLRRYKAMSDVGVRALDSYNSIVESEGGQKLPQIVVIIDELADLMIAAAKEVEESICRIAQMGRASGIHLIVATQRPSADVITGTMKANIPSRIAFAVSSAMESRIILDTTGAEALVGKGDMLYAPHSIDKPMRVQGCFVSDLDVEAVAEFVKSHFNSEYDSEVIKQINKRASQTSASKMPTFDDPNPNSDEMDEDELLPDAVNVLLETGQASVSMLQRRLKLGYTRAARIMDEMEEKGIVGPHQGSKPRAILVNREQWNAMRSGQSAQLSVDELPIAEVE